MKLGNIFLMAGALATALLVASCGGSKKATTSDNGLGQEVNTPCSDNEFQTDAKTFRGTGIGTSQDQGTAKTKARLDANRNLAEGINVKIKAVTDRYTNELEVGEASEFERKFEDLTRQVINQEMNNVAVVCQKMFNKEGKFTCYIATAVDKDQILNNIKESISKDSKLKLDYDKMKFEQVFNEEMAKLEEEQK